MKAPNQIEVLTLTPVPTGKALKALASVKVGQLVFHRLRLVEDIVGGLSLSGPQIVTETAEGPRHFTLVAFPKHWNTAIRDKVIAAYEDMQSFRSEAAR